MIDVTSTFRGITTPIPALTAQIEQLGWQLDKVNWSKDSYTARASNPHGEKLERTGVTDKTAVANVLLAIIRKHKVRNGAQHYGGMWAGSWTDKLPQIAEAYKDGVVYDPKAASAWKELAQDSVARHKVLEQQLKIEIVADPEPYASAKEMADDIHKNQHFLVSNAHCEHPVWSVDENVSFRIVHDVLGHAVSGGDFGWHGENLACGAHFPLLTATAQQALFVECIMQTGYAAYYRSFGPQKVFLPDPEMFQHENDPGHTGIHPSQSIAPVAMPELPASPTPEGVMEKGFVAPHMEGTSVPGTFSKMTEPQERRLWESFSPEAKVLHRFDDGSTIQQHTDPKPVGKFMHNCWQSGGALNSRLITGYAALHDPLGLPRVAFHLNRPVSHAHARYKNHVTWPLGMRNSDPTPEQMVMVEEFARTHGYEHEVPRAPPFMRAGSVTFPTGEATTYNSEHPLGQIATNHPNVDLTAWESSGRLKLNMIQVAPEHQGKGYASAALRDLVSYADANQLPMSLTPEQPEDRTGLSNTALKEWYRSHGFKPNKGRDKDYTISETMIRPSTGRVVSSLPKLSMTLRDPNHGWRSGFAPQAGTNAYTDMSVPGPDGKSTDPLDAEGVMQNAAKIDSKWSTWTKEDGSPDVEKMRHAIVNAFRVVLLSPRKDLRWNAVHYQDISHIPGNELDPAKYWDALEKSRQEWNVKHRGEDQRFAHLPFKKLLPKMAGVVFAHHTHLTMDQIHAKVNDLIYEWRVEEEHHVLQDDEGKATNKQKRANDVENKVNKNIEKRIKNFVADSVPAMDFSDERTAAADQMGFDMEVPEVEPEKPQQEQKYGAFMGTHLNAIAQVSEHSDSILKAALDDVKEHDASGHHFRVQVLQLGISGVGPKVCSFAWLLLQPLTSQLGTIDTHMMDVLGHNYEKEMSNRDYFCFTPENLVRAERGWTPISEISTDDRVLTNSGIFEKVEKIMVREYQGPLVEAKTAVGVAPIRMTPEHPVLKLSNPHKRSDHKNVCSPHKCRATEHLHELTWDNADSLGDNSYIVSRVIDESQLEDVKSIEIGGRTIPLTNDFLWIIGLYLAEGSTSDRVVQFSLNKTETVYQSRVIAFFQKKLNLRVHYAPSREGWNGVQLLIYDARLARAFSTTFGRGAKNKSIPAGILNLPIDRLRHVFDGIHSGDGCDSTSTLGQTSPTLALQVTEYLLRNGEMPSNSTWDDGDPNHSLAYITKYAKPKVHKNKRGFWNLGGERLVQTTVASSEYDGYVYNLEVAGDHTYIIQNVVVHNCFERELAAGRDASGYGHVPLGAFQWGMWDYKRTGPGTHQDHSAMAVHNPTDHNHINWHEKQDSTQTAKADWAKQAPWWWKQTELARQQTGEAFNQEVNTPQTKVPFQVEAMKKDSKPKPKLPTPWLVRGQDVHTGAPGQTYAQFIQGTLGVPAHEFWQTPGHAVGRFHHSEGRVEIVNGNIDHDTYTHLQEVLSPYNPPKAVV